MKIKKIDVSKTDKQKEVFKADLIKQFNTIKCKVDKIEDDLKAWLDKVYDRIDFSSIS
jgi:hypothetical protein